MSIHTDPLNTNQFGATLLVRREAMAGASSLRVAHVVGSFPPATAHGGPIESTFGLCRALVDQGCSVRVLTTDADGRSRASVTFGRWCALGGVQVLYSPTLTDRPFSPGLLARLPGVVRWADVIHVTGVYEHHTIPALAGCSVGRRPVVWSPRGSLQRWPNARRRAAKTLWERACLQVAPRRTVIHATSELEAHAVLERFSGADVAVVPNGVDLPTVPPPFPRQDILHIVFVGRLHPIKGLETLLEAGQLLLAQGFERWTLTVAGRGERAYEARLAAYSGQLGLTRNVRFVGWVDSSRRGELLGEADMVVLPSHVENFGMIVVEALAYARPVITTRGTPWRGVEDEGCGRWVEATPASLASAIRSLAAGNREEMGQRGRKWVEATYSWSSVGKRMVDVYGGLL